MLASASDCVRVWDASTMERPQRRVTTHGDALVRSVRWNHNVRRSLLRTRCSSKCRALCRTLAAAQCRALIRAPHLN